MKIKTLQSNSGGELVSKKFDNFLHECGIEWQTSALYTTKQNGVAERTNKTIMECARSMIHGQGFDLEFRAKVMNMAVYIKNWCPTNNFWIKNPTRNMDEYKVRCISFESFRLQSIYAHSLWEEKQIKV
jgi:hypothetical protein